MIIQIEGTSPTSLFRIELIVEVVSRIGRDSRCRVHGIKEKAIEEKSGDVYIYIYICIYILERREAVAIVSFGSMSNYVEKSLEPITQVAH